MVVVSAPSKAILLGEHAVVYGEPALSIAIDLKTMIRAIQSDDLKINGKAPDPYFHRYVLKALDLYADGCYALEINSRVPPDSGLGSSASVVVATVASIRKGDEEEIARRSFEVEYQVQEGKASPTDTSTVTHGNGILLSGISEENLLWTIRKGKRVWHIHHVDVPEMTMVIGYTGIKSDTAEMVARVREVVERTGYGPIKKIGELVKEGMKALEEEDHTRLGEIMAKNHALLVKLGVSSPELDALIEAVRPCSLGAKITGAGGGGSIIVLTDEPHECADAIEKAGGTPYVVKGGVSGVCYVD